MARGCRHRGDRRLRAAAGRGAGGRPADHDSGHGTQSGRGTRQYGPPPGSAPTSMLSSARTPPLAVPPEPAPRVTARLPARLGRPGDGTSPGEPGHPGEPNEPGQSGRPGDGTSLGEPGHPGEPNEPGQSGRPGASGEPDGSGHPAGRHGPAARINLTVPLATLLGLAEHPGEASGFGPIDPALARALAAQAAGHPATSWCVTVTDSAGHPAAHGCSRPGRRRQKTARSTGRARPDTQPSRNPPRDTGPAGLGSTSGPPGQPTFSTTGPPGQPTFSTNGPPGQPTFSTNGPPGQPTFSTNGPPGQPTFSTNGPPAGYGIWRLRPPGPEGTALADLTVDLEPIAVSHCDHSHQTASHDPSRHLRHLVEIRDGECTWPPCRREARRCDYEHTIAFENGGLTCACNGGPRCRHHHHQKQAAGWRLEQSQPGYHASTTPPGRTYATGPTTYPI